jgi:hypothetical protein
MHNLWLFSAPREHRGASLSRILFEAGGQALLKGERTRLKVLTVLEELSEGIADIEKEIERP